MQKIKRGSSFTGVLAYALAEVEGIPRGRILGGNMGGFDPQSLAKEFGISRRVRPDVAKLVWHNSLRLPAGDALTDEQWSKIADDYMQRMCFSDLHQRVYIMHDEPEGQHIHIIASRIGLDSELYLGKNENLQSTKIIQRLEKVYGLTITKGPDYQDGKIVMPELKRPTVGELGKSQRTGKQPTRYKLADLIDAALEGEPTAVQFVERLQAAGVTIKPNLGNEKLNGFSFELDGVPFKGSQLGNHYKGQALFQRGLHYEQSRDYESLKRLTTTAANDPVDPAVTTDIGGIGRSEDAGLGRDAESVSRTITGADQAIIEPSDDTLRARDSANDSNLASSLQNDDARSSHRADESASAADGGANRQRDDAYRDIDHRHSAVSGGVSKSHERAGHSVERGLPESGRDYSANAESIKACNQGSDGGDGLEYRGAAPESGLLSENESAIYLANPDHGRKRTWGGLGGPELIQTVLDNAALDRQNLALGFTKDLFEKMKSIAAKVMSKATTYYRDALADLSSYMHRPESDGRDRAVRKMLQALGCAEYSIGIIDPAKKLKPDIRSCSAEEFAAPETLALLRSKNAQGLDIYVRPKYPNKSGLVLVDGLSRAHLYELNVCGLNPAVVVQNSDHSYQAWIRINRGGFDKDMHAEVARLINEQVGDGLAATEQKRFGRLASFTNHAADCMEGSGLPPAVLLEQAEGRVSVNGAVVFEQAVSISKSKSQKAPQLNCEELSTVKAAVALGNDVEFKQKPLTERASSNARGMEDLLQFGRGMK